MTSADIPRFKLFVMAVSRLGIFMAILMLVIFAISGSSAYWQAWMYFLTLLVPMVLVLIYLMIYDPGLLLRRLQFHEKEAPQKLIIKLGTLTYIFIYLIPALDQRLGWTDVPALVSMVADIFVLLGYGTFVWVMRVNSYAARTVEVVDGQELISTGLYAVVRHPMYVGNILMYIATPIALASWWGLVPVLPFIAIMVYRIRNEEQVLMRDLAGYDAYMQKVRYRLIPGIW